MAKETVEGFDLGSDIDSISRILENAEIGFNQNDSIDNLFIEIEDSKITFLFDKDGSLINIQENL